MRDMLFMSRVTVEATAPLADLPGSNLFDRDKATAAMTAASPSPARVARRDQG